MTTNILFLCPHNAAKSVTAAVYMGRIADDRGLDLSISTAGTDPDDDVLPLVRDQLVSDGYTVNDLPCLVTPDVLSAAERIINIGCPHDLLPTDKAVTDWSIPNFSEDPSAAFAALSDHVEHLAREISEG